MIKPYIYMIVTNDQYETPVAIDIVGLDALAEYMNYSKSSVCRCFKLGWGNRKYKAIITGQAKNLSKEEVKRRGKIANDRWRRNHPEKVIEYNRRYYENKRMKANGSLEV